MTGVALGVVAGLFRLLSGVLIQAHHSHGPGSGLPSKGPVVEALSAMIVVLWVTFPAVLAAGLVGSVLALIAWGILGVLHHRPADKKPPHD